MDVSHVRGEEWYDRIGFGLPELETMARKMCSFGQMDDAELDFS